MRGHLRLTAPRSCRSGSSNGQNTGPPTVPILPREVIHVCVQRFDDETTRHQLCTIRIDVFASFSRHPYLLLPKTAAVDKTLVHSPLRTGRVEMGFAHAGVTVDRNPGPGVLW